MSAVSPISDVLNAPYSTPLVLPPSGDSSALELTATTTATTPAVDAAAAAPLAASDSSPLNGVTAQPLGVVLDALASAGVDSAINQELLTAPIGQQTGTLSTFIEELFTALAAQSTTADQNVQSAATPATAYAINAQAQAASVASAFAATAQSATPNSALENDVQNLAQAVNAQSVNPALTTDADAGIVGTLAPLQQSFDQLAATGTGGSGTATLGGFLDALAENLHGVQSPLGNVVDSLI
jgi:hypothetical protein